MLCLDCNEYVVFELSDYENLMLYGDQLDFVIEVHLGEAPSLSSTFTCDN